MVCHRIRWNKENRRVIDCDDFLNRIITSSICNEWSPKNEAPSLCESASILLPHTQFHDFSSSRKCEGRTKELSCISGRIEHIFFIRSYDHTLITDERESWERADRSRQYRTCTRSYRGWSYTFSSCSINWGKCQRSRDEKTEWEEWFHAKNYGTFISKSRDFAKRENERSEIENIFYTRAYDRITNYEQLPSYEETNILSKRESVFVKL